MCISSVFSLTMEYDQSDIFNSYNTHPIGNSILYTVVGDTDDYVNVNASLNQDYDWEFSRMNTPFYMLVNNVYENQTLRIMWRGDLNLNPTLYMQDFTFREKGKYIFKFTPSYDGEAGQIYVDYIGDFLNGTDPLAIGYIEFQEEKPRGFNSVMETFINSFVTVIEINVGAWRIMFYTLTFIIVVGFIGGLFGIAFTLFKYRQRLMEKKNRFSGLYKNKSND